MANEKWDVPKIWNGDVWIIGGGPSIIQTFNIPPEIVKKVRVHEEPLSAFSPYLSAIHDKNVIGINVAYELGDWVDFCFVGDQNFLISHRTPQLQKFNGVVVSCAKGAIDLNWVKYLEMHPVRKSGISNENGYVYWNLNSGAASFSLANLLGAKRIILVGFDMALSTDMHQHWHGEYRKGPRNREEIIKAGGLPFHKHLKGFSAIKHDADILGIEILNLSQDSAIKQFKKVTLNDVL